MAAVFAANTVCCCIIVGMTAWKRATFRMAHNELNDTVSAHRSFVVAPMNAASQHRS